MIRRRSVWFWQGIFSPHMAALAVALARAGCEVTYVAERELTVDRMRQGWKPPTLEGVTLRLMTSPQVARELLATAPIDCVHICSGVRGNGRVGDVQRELGRRRKSYWVMLETVDAAGALGFLRGLVYQFYFALRLGHLRGVLAIGHSLPGWIRARGVPPDLVYPFAYFLPDPESGHIPKLRQPGPFRFAFAGQLIPRKRLDWLIGALSDISEQDFELWIVGSGAKEATLRSMACRKLNDRVRWIGQLPISEVPTFLANMDCLVLPSKHDGWGAVVSEALMVGTQVICSGACGAAGVVRASGFGGVFNGNDRGGLKSVLEKVLALGPLSPSVKAALGDWAACLGGRAGAEYLLSILAHAEDHCPRPPAPWCKSARLSS